MAIAEFMRLGFAVSRPMSNGLAYDFIADDGVKLIRIQVKTGRMVNDCIKARLGSSKYHRGRRECVGYKGRVDWVVVVMQDQRAFYAIRPEDAGGDIHLRVTPSKNNQAAGVRWARDYELSRDLL